MHVMYVTNGTIHCCILIRKTLQLVIRGLLLDTTLLQMDGTVLQQKLILNAHLRANPLIMYW